MKKNDIIDMIEILKKEHPDATCSLMFTTPFEMAIAVMLSAQCTDERVNKITIELFKKYSTPKDFNEIPIEELEELIYSCGFYKNKAKNIKLLADKIIAEYNGILPDEMDKLIKLPGIGRKSANVIMLEAFNKPVGIAVDTHAKRISNRIGLSKQNDPKKIEQDLLKIIPKEYLKDVNHLFVFHGRRICKSQNPQCIDCPICKYCKFFKSLKEKNDRWNFEYLVSSDLPGSAAS